MYLTAHEKSLSRDGFGTLAASDQIRLLLSKCGIPLEVPTELTRLGGFAKKHDLDGPAAITEIRNGIVYPKPKRALSGDGADIIDAWHLSTWYIELALLSLCGYSEIYLNRLKRLRPNAVEKVPWAS